MSMDDVKKEWLRQAAEWRRFEGGAEAFWPGFLEVLVGVGGWGARSGVGGG